LGKDQKKTQKKGKLVLSFKRAETGHEKKKGGGAAHCFRPPAAKVPNVKKRELGRGGEKEKNE